MTDSTALVLAHAGSGERLPAGDLYINPISLPFGGNLRGASGCERTAIRPLTTGSGPLITVASPGRSYMANLDIIGSGPEFHQTGLSLHTSASLFRDVSVSGFENGVLLEFSVDNTFRECQFRANNCNIAGLGDGSGQLSVTTTRFLYCGIRYAMWCGAYLAHGWGYDFTGSIVESNAQVGMMIVATPLSSAKSVDPVCLTNVWFEDNGPRSNSNSPNHLRVLDSGIAADPGLFTTQTSVRRF